MLTNLLLAISTSIDSIGIGVTYGIRNINICRIAKFILFIISFIISFFAIILGNILGKILNPNFAKYLSSGILICVGILLIFQTFKKNNKEKIKTIENNIEKNDEKNSKKNKEKEKEKSKEKSKEIYQLIIKTFGITIKIIKNPVSSDFNKSDNIEAKEAIYLAIALSIDAFSVALGSACVSGISLTFPFLVSMFQIIFLSLGRNLGERIQKNTVLSSKVYNLIAGIVLIFMGVVRI